MAPAPAMIAHGWELHSTQDGSDKFYRVLVIGTVTLINYGPKNTTGQFIAHCFAGVGDAAKTAQEKARILTNAKSEKGYRITRDFTEFTVDRPHAALLADLGYGSHRVNGIPVEIRETIVARFRRAADEQGTAAVGASL
ncbi:WGR domain-containing protein [Amycolatopsis sp. cmx-4-54]|uniref:WGR domain-containing protein n=1 Tax=Amycolatopsis sp. cmx-4-54 TaxID=2790936 RepID=UPI00397E401B